MQILIALFIFVVIIYGEYKIIVYAHRSLKSIFLSNSFVLLSRIVLVIVSAVFGVLIALVPWQWSETSKFIGLPIPWVAWEYVDGKWLDFISPISILLWFFDFIIGIGFVHLIAACILWIRNRRAKLLPKEAT